MVQPFVDCRRTTVDSAYRHKLSTLIGVVPSGYWLRVPVEIRSYMLGTGMYLKPLK